MAERDRSSEPPSPARPGPTAYEPQPGELFASRYRIEQLLGRGASGAVWAALDEGVGDRVALKLLTRGPDDAAERFRREVRLARRVTHRNAARIFDLGTLDDILYLTMELVRGESLEAMLDRERALPVAQAAEIGRQIADGLAAAHEVSVVHRDIKPANVLLEETGRVVLTDFSVARAVANDPKVTLGAVIIGTPSYMAPEQVRGEEVGPAADLYALGAMLYEMLTGVCPFVGDSVVATATARLESDPRDPREHVDLPAEVVDLVLALMARAPEARPESAAAVAARLAEITLLTSGGDAAVTLFGGPGAYRGSARSAGTASGARSSRSAAWRAGANSTFIEIAPRDRTLAVLPFRTRGDDEHAHLAETAGEDLVDVLTTTRGLRVTAWGATARYRGQSVDPREAGRELGVDAIVDGSLRVSGDRVRVSARLVDVASGEQLWAARFEEPLADGFETEEVLAQRIGESLRIELELLGARHSVPEEAVALLLEARQLSRSSGLGDEGLTEAMARLDRALEIAPDFPLAMATHADYAVRRWFLPSQGGDEEVSKRAHDSVARALEQAGDVPLSHLAAGRLAVSDGRISDAASQLAIALSMAPTFAAAHDYLGMLQCEAGRGSEGERHILLARRIDPGLPPRAELARRRALAGDLDGYRELLEELRANTAASRFMVVTLEMRIAGWFGDLDTVRRCRPASFIPPGHAYHRFLEAQRAGLLREGSSRELLDSLAGALSVGAGPRLDAFARQQAVEALVPLGDLDGAFEVLRVTADSPSFVDTDWMERCPPLAPLRERAEFATLAAQVQRRADGMWRQQS